MRIDKIQGELLAETHAFDTLSKTDYTDQIAAFEARRVNTLATIKTTGEQALQTIAQCDAQLAAEAQWKEQKAVADTQVEALMRQFTAVARGGSSDLDREIGAAQAERSMLEAQHAKAVNEHRSLEAQIARGGIPCPTCGKPMDSGSVEKLANDKADEIERIVRGMRSFESKLLNLRTQLSSIQQGSEQARAGIEAQLATARQRQEQIGTGLSTFTRLRANREEAERVLTNARAQWVIEEGQENPFTAHAERLAIQLESLAAKVEDLKKEHSDLSSQAHTLDFWDEGFGPKGLPVLVFRTVIYELEQYANRFLSQIVGSRLFCRLLLEGDDLTVQIFEQKRGQVRERRYEQLSSGQRRCVELSFAPFALSEMIFNRCGVRVDLIVIDELTTHLGADEKPAVCEALRKLDRGTVLVIDHDVEVQSEFDVTYELKDNDGAIRLERAS
jgi:DNA repair exonuclease SbcCD ATPase subunit